MSREGERPGGLLANATVTYADGSDVGRVRRLDGSDGAPSAAGTQSTGGGAKKIQLAAGYSQMDWMRLTKREPDMNGLRGGTRRKDITMTEVATHGTEADGWTVLRGKVYNLSPYLDFHPGGRKILTQALGKDCTALFDRYHRWVNGGYMLEKCKIGVLEGNVDSDEESSDDEGDDDFTFDQPSSSS